MTDTERRVVVCASANPDKVAEIVAIVGDLVELRLRPHDIADVVEDAETLEGNARLKAAAIAAATDLPALADDTGLFVDALDGQPGVRSARYAGEGCTYSDNRAKLLEAMTDAPTRRAVFRTVAMVCWPDGHELAVEGSCEGTIADSERGDGGFGYDPLFVPDDGDGRTFAEMSDGDKNLVSHRGRAMRALATALRMET